jgi:hypothetical protein
LARKNGLDEVKRALLRRVVHAQEADHQNQCGEDAEPAVGDLDAARLGQARRAAHRLPLEEDGGDDREDRQEMQECEQCRDRHEPGAPSADPT